MKIADAIAALGSGPLTEEKIAQHIAPLFSRVLASDRVYLENHSLGRPLDATAADLAEGAALWYVNLGDAWDAWTAEREAFRSRLARIINAPRPDCIVPRTSAGQGLRAVLNAMPGRPRVLTTRGEFDAVDIILKQYAALEKIDLRWVETNEREEFSIEDLIREVDRGVDLVVVSQVMFMTSQIIGTTAELARLADACHAHGARLLIDAYHAVGVIPVDVQATNTDYLIGGSYKYLRGGPGAAYLYVSPQMLEEIRPLDTGWFAKSDMWTFQRPDPPVLKPGGDALLEGTPAVLTWYQARSGQEFALAMGIDRLREYSLCQLNALRRYLTEAGIQNITGGDERHGAFLTVRLKNAMDIPAVLTQQGIDCDARAEWLRLCPDCLTRDEDLQRAARALAGVLQTAGTTA
jgi:kynureninase